MMIKQFQRTALPTKKTHMQKSLSHYQICVAGNLEAKWMDWFEGFALEQKGDKTLLSGTVPDQAALFGVLARIRDLGLPLISLQLLESTPGEDGNVSKN